MGRTVRLAAAWPVHLLAVVALVLAVMGSACVRVCPVDRRRAVTNRPTVASGSASKRSPALQRLPTRASARLGTDAQPLVLGRWDRRSLLDDRSRRSSVDANAASVEP